MKCYPFSCTLNQVAVIHIKDDIVALIFRSSNELPALSPGPSKSNIVTRTWVFEYVARNNSKHFKRKRLIKRFLKISIVKATKALHRIALKQDVEKRQWQWAIGKTNTECSFQLIGQFWMRFKTAALRNLLTKKMSVCLLTGWFELKK